MSYICAVLCCEHVCYGMQVWNEQQPNEETLAFVVRTGLCTTMGLMLRRVMAPLSISGVPFAKVNSLSTQGCTQLPQRKYTV